MVAIVDARGLTTDHLQPWLSFAMRHEMGLLKHVICDVALLERSDGRRMASTPMAICTASICKDLCGCVDTPLWVRSTGGASFEGCVNLLLGSATPAHTDASHPSSPWGHRMATKSGSLQADSGVTILRLQSDTSKRRTTLRHYCRLNQRFFGFYIEISWEVEVLMTTPRRRIRCHGTSLPATVCPRPSMASAYESAE